MGEYRCPVKNELKPKSHNEWHPDWASYVCPVLRAELEIAAVDENYKRVAKLYRLGIKYFPDYFPLI